MTSFIDKIRRIYSERSLLDRFIIKGILVFLLYLLISPIFKHFIPLSKWMILSIVHSTAYILELMNYKVETDLNLIIVNDMDCVRVLKSCLAKRQFFVFGAFLLIYPGTFKFKLWYIPAGLLFLQLFNIIRITILTVITYENFEKYDFYHDFVFKVLFYLIIFALWLIAIKVDKPKVKPSMEKSV